MAIVLPTKRQEVSSFNPRLIILFGKPKSGKSTLMASLDDNLIIDLEDGYKSLPVMKVDCKNYLDLAEVVNALKAKTQELNGKKPYKFITLDNASRIEEMAVAYAADLYRNTPMGQTFGYKKTKENGKEIFIKDQNGNCIKDPKADVRMLPNGAGWLYMRQATMSLIKCFIPYCDTLILISHVKEREININSEIMSEVSVDLAGKTGDILCGEADAIGYIYRKSNETHISFEGGDGGIRESRCKHLSGKNFVVATSDEKGNLNVDMSKIFLNGDNQ